MTQHAGVVFAGVKPNPNQALSHNVGRHVCTLIPGITPAGLLNNIWAKVLDHKYRPRHACQRGASARFVFILIILILATQATSGTRPAGNISAVLALSITVRADEGSLTVGYAVVTLQEEEDS